MDAVPQDEEREHISTALCIHLTAALDKMLTGDFLFWTGWSFMKGCCKTVEEKTKRRILCAALKRCSESRQADRASNLSKLRIFHQPLDYREKLKDIQDAVQLGLCLPHICLQSAEPVLGKEIVAGSTAAMVSARRETISPWCFK